MEPMDFCSASPKSIFSSLLILSKYGFWAFGITQTSNAAREEYGQNAKKLSFSKISLFLSVSSHSAIAQKTHFRFDLWYISAPSSSNLIAGEMTGIAINWE